ncbi:MAG: hypothetical protein KKD39_01630 [Candidatus Altiarchaeota archaeon]|nr:hypothetical protein [Candidatus Altiarchaeota archaeon]
MRAITVFLAIIVLLHSVSAQECEVNLRDNAESVEAVVESCYGVGTYSLGGRYGDEWKTLSFNYPRPWKGSFTSYKIDDTVFCTSPDPRNCTQTDDFVSAEPAVYGDRISLSWIIEGVSITQTFRLVENKTVIEYVFGNQDSVNHSIGLRIHLDTMLGVNDGAPIYIPADGLKTVETLYEGDSIGFGYFKAYNQPEKPTIVSTGVFDPAQSMTQPAKFVIAEWKKSKDTAWEYIPQGLNITGDSSILSYYDIGVISPGEDRSVAFSYGGGQPILRNDNRYVGVAEIVLDKITGRYCPDEQVTFKVDVLSIGVERYASAYLIVESEGEVYYNKSQTYLFPKDDVKTLEYNWFLGEHETDRSYTISAVLVNDSSTLDVYKKTDGIRVELGKCGNPIVEAGKKAGVGILLILAYLAGVLAVAAFIVFLAYLWMNRGEVEFTKYVDGEQVFVKVENKTLKTMRNAEIEDPLPENSEVKVQTMDVLRSSNQLRWAIGDIKPGKSATLEYWVRDGHAYGTSKLKWDGGERDI